MSDYLVGVDLMAPRIAELERRLAEAEALASTLRLRCGYVLNTCIDTREMRLEAEAMLRLIDIFEAKP